MNFQLTGALAIALLACGCAGPAALPDRLTDPGEQAELTKIDQPLLHAQQQERERRRIDDLAALRGTPNPVYLIGAGDVLTVFVWDHPELNGRALIPTPNASDALVSGSGTSNALLVDHDGMLHFPYAGMVRVAGLSEAQAAAALAQALSKYLRSPRVTLAVQSYRSKRVYVDGEVKNPGLYPVNDIPMSLPEALHRAGGVLPTGDRSRVVLERSGRRYLIDLRDLDGQDINASTIMLQHGDRLQVGAREQSRVFVTGEVQAPRALSMHDGRMSLNEALGESGGMNPTTSEPSQVYVVRRGARGPQVFQLDARAPGAMAIAEQFELEPKDLVYVSPSALANWHRKLSLLFPSELSSAVGAAKP